MDEKIKKVSDKVGEVYKTKCGKDIEIIEDLGWGKCSIKFLYNGIVLKNLYYSNIQTGAIKNPYHPSVCGVGYLGIGRYKSEIKGVPTREYVSWSGIIRRSSIKYHSKRNCYKGASVCEEWKCFQNFAEWFHKWYEPYMENNWVVDKDILVRGNKIYSPETCNLVPKEINSLFTKSNKSRGKYPIGVTFNKKKNKFEAFLSRGENSSYLGAFNTPEEAFKVYKIAKESWIKELANKWKGKISDRLYWVMCNYKVEIDD